MGIILVQVALYVGRMARFRIIITLELYLMRAELFLLTMVGELLKICKMSMKRQHRYKFA